MELLNPDISISSIPPPLPGHRPSPTAGPPAAALCHGTCDPPADPYGMRSDGKMGKFGPCMVFLWIFMDIYGLFMDHLWSFMVYFWTIYDHLWIFMVYSWTIYGPFLGDKLDKDDDFPWFSYPEDVPQPASQQLSGLQLDMFGELLACNSSYQSRTLISTTPKKSWSWL